MAYDKIRVPAGEKITMKDGVLQVPDNPVIPFVEGDGTGPDITRAAMTVWNAAVKAAYGEPDKIRGDKYIYYCDEDKSIGLVFEIENNRVDEIEMGYLG